MKYLYTKFIVTTIGLTLCFVTFAAQAQSPLDSLDCLYLEEIFIKVSDAHAATTAFYEALESLRSSSRKDRVWLERLKVDVHDIITREEIERYKKLKSFPEKAAFYKRFWLIRDLTPATESNETLVEHYTRLNYVREKYSSIQWRGYDDRGRIYIKYGAPDETIIDAMPSGSDPIETWAYYRFGSPVTFDFVFKGYDYRLARRLDEGIKMKSMPPAYVSALHRLLIRRAFLSPEYTSAFIEVLDLYNKRLEVQMSSQFQYRIERVMNRYEIEQSNLQASLPPIVTDIFHETSGLPLSIRLLLFKQNLHYQELVLAYGFKTSDIKQENNDSRVEIMLNAAVRDTNRLFLASKNDTLSLSIAGVHEKEAFVGMQQFTLPIGRYFVALDISCEATRQRGLKDFTVTTGNFSNDRLQLSSVIFAEDVRTIPEIEPTSNYFVRRDLAIKPYPFKELGQNERLYIYFEIYNLRFDAFGETRYEIEYQLKSQKKGGFFAKLNPFGGKDKTVSVTDIRSGNASDEPTFLQLDFSRLKRGRYDLVVRVTDKVAQLTKEKKMELVLK